MLAEAPVVPAGLVIGIIAALIIMLLSASLLVLFTAKSLEKEISSAEDEAKRIINEAIKSAENKKRESLLEAKEEIHRNRSEYEREVKERRAELQKQERRLQQKEENLDKKTDNLDRKADSLNEKITAVEAQQEEINRIKKSQLDMLEKISGYSIEDAKAYLIDSIRTDVTHEMAMTVKEVEAQYKDEADEKAREIIATAIQRCAADHASEVTVSVVQLPNDEMKGRIIGREGRNIRSIEQITGCDLIIDDTPKPSRFPALIPSAAKWQGWHLKSLFRMVASIPPASKKWLRKPKKRSTPPLKLKASAPYSKPTFTV